MSALRLDLQVCMNQLGGLDVSRYESRLALQKHTYLLQLFGVDLGYRFHWYLAGPYCTSLTADAYALDRQAGSVDDLPELEPWAQKALDKYRNWVFSDKPEGVPETTWLEILASLHYMLHVMVHPSDYKSDEASVRKELLKRKPYLEPFAEAIAAAWKSLDRVGLIKNKVVDVQVQ